MKWHTEGSFSTGTTASGLDVLVHTTEKFKTTTLKLFCHNPLDNNATRNALLPFVLKRGTRDLPDTPAITHHLEHLYGAAFDVDLLKIGERQVHEFRVNILNDRYARRGSRLLEAGLRFLRDLVRDPVRENGGFSAEYFRNETHHLRRLLQSRINDKSRYAAERLVQEMCRDEPYGIHELGDPRALGGLRNHALQRYYEGWIPVVPMNLYVVGDVDRDHVADLAAREFDRDGDRRGRAADLPAAVRRRPRSVKTVDEFQDVQQGKLAIGYRTSLAADDPRLPALQFASAILGGGSFSKLFRIFRERESLAYYAYSSLERIKGILTVHAGIDPRDYTRAMRVLRAQIRDVVRGEISPFEIDSAREQLLHRIRALEDSPASLIRSTLVARTCGRPLTMRQALARYRNVTREKIVEAARSLKLDTVYFLRSRDGEEA